MASSPTPPSGEQPCRADAVITPGEPAQLRKETRWFLLGATLFSWPLMVPVWLKLAEGFEFGNEATVSSAFGSWLMLFGAGPMVAALAVTLRFRGIAGVAELLRRVVRWRIGPHWFFVAAFLPLIPQWLGLWTWSRVTGNPIHLVPWADYAVSWLQITAISTLFFITEELGWRGFWLPRALARTSWLRAALLVGLVWGIWHYPFWLTASWAMTGDLGQSALMACASTGRAIALSVMLTWVFRNTRGSVLPAMLFHGANNANFDKMFSAAGDISQQGPSFLVTQSVAALVAAAVLVAILREKPTAAFGSGAGQ